MKVAQTFVALTMAASVRGFAFVSRSALSTTIARPVASSAVGRGVSGLRMMSDSPVDFAKTEIANNKVVVFSKSFCPFCKKTKALFDSKKVDYMIYELNEMDDGAAIQDALLEISGQNTVPNVFINGEHLGGNSEAQTANGSGKLDELLAAAGAM
jgi:glutaredoxin 3